MSTLTTGYNSIDSLVASSWNSRAGKAVNLTYSFLTQLPKDATAEDATGFAPMTATQQAGVVKAMAAWSAVANISFTEVASGGNILLGTNDQGDVSSGYAYRPRAGDDSVSLYTNNQDAFNFSFTDGNYGIAVLIHELGHTLGLKHPGNYNAGGGTVSGPFLPADTDTRDYSQMSYNNGAGFALDHKYGTTAMLYDIQAVQYLYGANMSYHTGADTYSFGKGAALQCIWDAGGTDTFDFSACRDTVVINLNAGGFSSTAPNYYNISIAYNVTIERAIAGSGGSFIFANAAGNVITGGAGNDVVYEGAGSDTISGNGGTDTVVFAKAWSSYLLDGTLGKLSVSGEGTDSLSGISKLEFSDTTINLHNYIAVVAGTSGNDTLKASAGNQIMAGGAGIDTLALKGSMASYQLTASGSAVTLTDLAGTGGIDLLNSVERLTFSDGALALDINGAAGSLYRLYSAMFNRAPDKAGLGYWLKGMDEGVSVFSVANGFIDSKEFTSIYGANATDTTFVTALYSNVLHRAPDAAGLSFWLDSLSKGITRADALVGFSDSAENIAVMAEIIPVGISYTPYTA